MIVTFKRAMLPFIATLGFFGFLVGGPFQATQTLIVAAATSQAPLHVLTWTDTETRSRRPTVGPSSYGPYVNFVMTGLDGAKPELRAAGMKVAVYTDPNRWVTPAGTYMNSLMTMDDVAKTCDGTPIRWTQKKNGPNTIYVLDIRSPDVARKWKQTIDHELATGKVVDYVFEDTSDDPYHYASPGPPCDTSAAGDVKPETWTRATEEMQKAIGYPIIFNGLVNGSDTHAPESLNLVNGPAVGGLSEACYGTYKRKVHKNYDDAWKVNERTEIRFAQAGKLYICHNQEESDGSTEEARDARMFQYASFLMTYDPHTSVYSSHWAVGSSNVRVQPETQLVPLSPSPAAEPTDIESLRESDGNYHRHYSNCYLAGVDHGKCEVVVNPSGSSTNKLSAQFTVGHHLVLNGSGVLDGGTATIDAGGVTSLGPTEGEIVFP